MAENKEIVGLTHKQLVDIGYRWILKNASCGCAFKEYNSANDTGEQPDVIGFGGWGHSVLIEVKCSRSDFFCDKNKPFRKNPATGMGKRRYYLCPEGLIKPEELPEKWGLIYVNENGKARVCVQPQYKEPYDNPIGNRTHSTHWHEHECNKQAEMALMYSALRRIHLRGLLDTVYEPAPENTLNLAP